MLNHLMTINIIADEEILEFVYEREDSRDTKECYEIENWGEYFPISRNELVKALSTWRKFI